MSQETAGPVSALAAGPDRVFRDALQLIAEGVTQTVGFKIASISVVRTAPDGTQELEVIADAGDESGNERIIGRRTPLASLLMEIEKAEDWGLFKYLPHDLLETQDVADDYGWVVPDMEVIDAPDAWHPLDLLVALLYDDHGVLRGTLAIDVPDNGRRPGPQQRQLLEKFAEQAGRTVVTTLEREELAEQVRLADTARTDRPQRQRAAGPERDPGGVPVRTGRGLPVPRVVDPDLRRGRPRHGRDLLLQRRPGRAARPPRRARRAIRPAQLGRPGGRRHRRQPPDPAGPHPDEHRSVVSFLDSIGIGSMMFVPLGAGGECLGNLVLTRAGRG